MAYTLEQELFIKTATKDLRSEIKLKNDSGSYVNIKEFKSPLSSFSDRRTELACQLDASGETTLNTSITWDTLYHEVKAFFVENGKIIGPVSNNSREATPEP